MKIKLSKSQWEEMGKKAGWTKEAQDKMNWFENQGPIEQYIIKCVHGMIELRGGISLLNAAGQLAHHAKQYYDEISERVNVPDL